MKKKKKADPTSPPSSGVTVEPPSAAGSDPVLFEEPKSKLGETAEDKVKNEDQSPDEAVAALRTVLQGIQTGNDISANEPLIARLVNNQEARAKVINSLIMTHDYERLIKFIEVRKNMDRILLEAASKKEAQPSEIMAIYRLMNTEVEEISGRMRANMMGQDDMMNLIQKVSWVTNMSDEDLASKFKGTSSQGREIVRKVGFRLRKAAKLLGPPPKEK